MSIQFAGSKSQDDRRRRRLVVNADDSSADGTVAGEGLSGGVASELVASAAAAPWVPVFEWRIWTYAALIGLVITGAAVALAMPLAFRPELEPLTHHLLRGERPMLAVLIQTTLCFLSGQLAILITWYRAQCKLDFRGRYRVWPWAALAFMIAAACSITNAHALLGQMLERSELIPWRPRVVAWLFPSALAALPLVLLLDRDVRRSRSSLYTLRVSWGLALATACLELFAEDLQSLEWTAPARVILPMFVAATVFVKLWLHARIVAYVCPDPPEANEVTAAAQMFVALRWMLAALGWIGARLVWRRKVKEPVVEVETKPKRGRKKATADDEEPAAPKRKRKAPAKRASKPRARKVAEVEEEEVEEEEQETGYDYEPDEASDQYEAEAEEAAAESNEWEDAEPEPEPEPEPPPPPVRSNRDSRPAPQQSSGNSQYSSGNSNSSGKKSSGWQEPEPEPEASSEDDDDGGDDDDASLRRDGAEDPLKGLSKRQKRELRRQQRQQRR